MKLFILALSLVILAAADTTCKNRKETSLTGNCYKGRLEIKANCMNYTISILEGTMDTSLYMPEWTDESTGKSYRNVFALGSKCNFPNTIREGDEFYFKIDTTTSQDCAVCLLYYPVPGKHLEIKVLEESCTPQ